jgi:hypothetical protein
LDLLRTLMQYRQEPIHSVLLKIRDKYSMLHLDVLLLIYHFAKICSGSILEIGAFVGDATIAAAFRRSRFGPAEKADCNRGWLLKWIGSLLVRIGVFTMFYLQPYRKQAEGEPIMPSIVAPEKRTREAPAVST